MLCQPHLYLSCSCYSQTISLYVQCLQSEMNKIQHIQLKRTMVQLSGARFICFQSAVVSNDHKHKEEEHVLSLDD